VIDPPYEVQWSRTARKAIGEQLPESVAIAAVEFITERLARNPRRLGKALGAELSGIFSARLLRQWRVLYGLDEGRHLITVLDIRRRATAYHRR